MNTTMRKRYMIGLLALAAGAEPFVLDFVHLVHPALPEQARDAIRADLSSLV